MGGKGGRDSDREKVDIWGRCEKVHEAEGKVRVPAGQGDGQNHHHPPSTVESSSHHSQVAPS